MLDTDRLSAAATGLTMVMDRRGCGERSLEKHNIIFLLFASNKICIEITFVFGVVALTAALRAATLAK